MAEKSKKETIGDRVRMAREQLGWGTPRLAKSVGVKSQTVQDLESGESRGTKYLLAFARALMQDPEWLESGKGQMRKHFNLDAINEAASKSREIRAAATLAPNVRKLDDPTLDLREIEVIAAAQAGAFLPSIEWPIGEPTDRFSLPLPIPVGYRNMPVVGLMVRGPSMDEIYPHGSIVICVRYMDLGRPPRSGERVVALRFQHGATEASVKEFRLDRDGRARLWPRSTHPDWQAPLLLDQTTTDDEAPQITYLVIGSYRPEV